MHTEKEALERWCPFARVVEADEDSLQGPFNRYHSSLGHTNNEACCIGSQCMAWRWVYEPEEPFIEAIKRYREETTAGLHDAKAYVEAHPEYRHVARPVTGYCGLAGKPQP